jgi:hypothetical protein
MKKIDIEELKKLNFDKGEKLLLDSGYVQNDAATTDGEEYLEDTYFTLYENGNEADVISYTEKLRYIENDEPECLARWWSRIEKA